MIWQYLSLAKQIPSEFRLSLDEGGTELVKVVLTKEDLKKLKVRNVARQEVYLKLETQNPNESFKDRSLAFQVSYYYSKNKDNLLISSSGNAAVSAAKYCALAGLNLVIFISNNINPVKLKKLSEIADDNPNISIVISVRPKSEAIKYSKAGNYLNLRGSTDDAAVEGFKTIAYELNVQLKDADAIFIPTSSATSAVGIAKGYKELGERMPRLNVCQTTKIHSIAKEFDILYEETDTSVADAITDRVAKRKSEILGLITESNGYGWVLSDEDIKEAVKFLQEKTKLPNLTPNGVLSFAGLIKALRRHKQYQKPICIISGI